MIFHGLLWYHHSLRILRPHCNITLFWKHKRAFFLLIHCIKDAAHTLISYTGEVLAFNNYIISWAEVINTFPSKGITSGKMKLRSKAMQTCVWCNLLSPLSTLCISQMDLVHGNLQIEFWQLKNVWYVNSLHPKHFNLSKYIFGT